MRPLPVCFLAGGQGPRFSPMGACHMGRCLSIKGQYLTKVQRQDLADDEKWQMLSQIYLIN